MTQTSEGVTSVVEDSVTHIEPEIMDGAPVFDGTDVPAQSLFDCLDSGYNLYAFLDQFPAVRSDQALAAIEERLDAESVIHSDRQIVSGTPVFVGTRVFVKNLFDYLAHGYSLDVFLDHFPTVSREQAVKTLEMAKRSLESYAYENAFGPCDGGKGTI